MAHEVNHSRQELAAQVREALRSRIGADRFDLWISDSTSWDLNTHILTLGFATEFESQLCRKTIGSELGQLLRIQLNNESCEIRFQVVPRDDSKTFDRASQLKANQYVNSRRSSSDTLAEPLSAKRKANATSSDLKRLADAKSSSSKSAMVSPHDPFQQILTGDSNEMAVAAVKMAATEPGRLSPIVMHGPPGCGKSMLLSAIAQRLRSEMRLRRVVLITSEQFTNDFTEGLRGGGLPMFRRKYRDVEALLLDDVQFFAGKRSTLAEVRHTIDNLIRTGKQVVVSLDRPLSDLSALGEELLGRLRGGLVTPVFPLDNSVRLGLLKRLTSQAGVELDDGVLDQLAERISGDGRLLRGVVHRLTAVSALTKTRLSWDKCWSAVFDLIQANQPVVRLADIERAVCGMFGLQEDSLQSESKTRSISQPRMLAMFLARKHTPAAYKEIGEYFGRRRHSTVISAEKTVENWLKDNAKLDGPLQLCVRDALRQVTSQLQVG